MSFVAKIKNVWGLQAVLSSLQTAINSLQTAIGNKADTTHDHAQNEITGLVNALTGKADATALAAKANAYDLTALTNRVVAIEEDLSSMQPETLTPQQILDKVKEVDGTGSGLDADTLDGVHASEFVKQTDATPGNTPGYIVRRDSNGNFIAGTITVTDIIIA